jgi:hypothetical protein
MKILKLIWAELIGLFVDDGRFALAILIWLAVAGLVLPRLPLPSPVAPIILALGLIAILIESALRAARGRKRP